MFSFKRMFILLMVLVLVVMGCAKKEEPQVLQPLEGNINDLASEFIAFLVQEDFKSASDYFDGEMLKALPQDKLGETWKQLKEQVGGYQDELSRKQDVTDGYDVIIVTAQFEKSPLNIRVVFNLDKRISGLFFQPAENTSAGKYEVPAYADLNRIIEEEVVIGEGDWALPGTLTLPLGDGPWPTVVLVHGSGPNDRDETIGPNKPFKDLALGLATRGIGVLRYDKRTLVHGEKMISAGLDLTVQSETIEDALLGISLLKGKEKVDPSRIYLLGHSLGGMLAPRIKAQTNDLAGLIILAGATRPLEDLIVEQTTYLAKLDGNISDSEKTKIAEMEKLALKVKNPALDPNTPASELMGVPAGYWLDLQGYQPAELAKTQDVKMLIIQGERDYQVTIKDFQIWQKTLKGRDDVIFKSFPSLNHLMMEGTGSGKGKPEEYLTPDHVAEEVIGEIFDFILPSYN